MSEGRAKSELGQASQPKADNKIHLAVAYRERDCE